VPFLIGGILGPIGLYMRRAMEETPAYVAAIEAAPEPDQPSGPVLAMRAFGFTIVWTVCFYILLNYMPTWTQKYLKLTAAQALWANTIGLLVLVVAIPLMALGTYVGLVALAVWPLGGEALPLALLAWLVEVCNTWAVWLSQTPQALVWLPSWGWAALVLPCLGTLCAMLMQRGWLAVVGLACSALVAVGIAVPAPKQMLLGGSQPIPQRLQTPTQQWGDAWLTLTPAGTYAIQVVHDPRSLQAYVSRTVLPLAQPVSAKLAKPFPIATPQPFLYATQSGVQPWQVVPLACQRPWQRVAQVCWP
jgi:hypothetical protein